MVVFNRMLHFSKSSGIFESYIIRQSDSYIIRYTVFILDSYIIRYIVFILDRYIIRCTVFRLYIGISSVSVSANGKTINSTIQGVPPKTGQPVFF